MTLAEAVKPKSGGNYSAVGGFSFFGGNDFGRGGKTKNLAVSCFSFFGGNVNGD